MQAYASANSGDSSGEASKHKDKLSADKRSTEHAYFNQTQKTSCVRFNSLADISNKFNTHKKLKFKNGKAARNDFRDMRTVLGKIDQNSSHYMNNSASFYQPPLVKSHSLYQKHPDDSKDSSEGCGILNFSYENPQANQGLSNKENINLLESNMTIEDNMDKMPPLPSILYPNPICKPIKFNYSVVGIDKPKEISQGNEGGGDRPKCNCKKSK